jgi:hypothetical protein
MIIFAIIIFGLATVRTFVPLMKEETYAKLGTFIGTISVAGTMLWCYIWFLLEHIKLK